ncbi:pantoate--beta-alanine ligase [bacterium]|nr:MAG: pantoate--beta-alanine ligase [bacterium]
MKTIDKISDMQSMVRQLRRNGDIIGLVPTMGYLHQGHISLIRIARKKCDTLVVSIFVNPTQFCPGEDFDKYPRDMKRDQKICSDEGVDIIFAPSTQEMYPDKSGYSAYVDMAGDITDVLCGKYRPGHFRGVMTIVAKLFNIIQPDVAVFGQKDGQQAVIIKKMVMDLNFPIDIIIGPTIRESDGLALSSRNKYLTAEQRKQAPAIYKSLMLAKNMIQNGERDAKKIIQNMSEFIINSGDFKIQYIDIVDMNTLQSLEHIEGEIMIALAVFLGETRLIDNIILRI